MFVVLRSLQFSVFESAGREQAWPSLLHNANSSQLRVWLEGVTPRGNDSRFALEFQSVGDSGFQGRVDVRSSIDDEYTPSIFKVQTYVPHNHVAEVILIQDYEHEICSVHYSRSCPVMWSSLRCLSGSRSRSTPAERGVSLSGSPWRIVSRSRCSRTPRPADTLRWCPWAASLRPLWSGPISETTLRSTGSTSASASIKTPSSTATPDTSAGECTHLQYWYNCQTTGCQNKNCKIKVKYNKK